jgi:anthranilate synthase component 1
VLETRGDTTRQTFRDGTVKTYQGDPFGMLPQCLAPYQPIKLPHYRRALAASLGFGAMSSFNGLSPPYRCMSAPPDLPDGLWMQVDSLLIFDQVKRKIWVIAYGDLRQPGCDSKRPMRRPAIAFKRSCKNSPLPSLGYGLWWVGNRQTGAHPLSL